jgi:hypothetical protein
LPPRNVADPLNERLADDLAIASGLVAPDLIAAACIGASQLLTALLRRPLEPGLDPVMGQMSVRVASYFPFNVTCYLNGHSFVAQEPALFRYEKEFRGYARLDFRRDCGLSATSWRWACPRALGRLGHLRQRRNDWLTGVVGERARSTIAMGAERAHLGHFRVRAGP